MAERRPWLGFVLLPAYLWLAVPTILAMANVLRDGIRDLGSLMLFLIGFGVIGRSLVLLWGITAGLHSMRSQAAGFGRVPPSPMGVMAFVVAIGGLASAIWTLWFHVHNAPIRMWWHPWYDYAPAIQLVLTSIAAGLLLVAIQTIRILQRGTAERADGRGLVRVR